MIDKLEKLKAGIRAKVEHPFRILKRQFGYQKVRYRGAEEEHAADQDTVCAGEPMEGAPPDGCMRGTGALRTGKDAWQMA